MDYCLGDGAGGASMWTGQPDVDVDADGDLDGVRLDFDGDGAFDDALADFDHDGLADHAVVNLDDDGAAVRYTDDGSGTWALTAAGTPIGPPRWLGLDGVEHPPTATTDFDGDGRADRLLDTDRDGLADRVLRAGDGGFDAGWVDTDGDGRWDVRLSDGDGDGAADDAGRV